MFWYELVVGGELGGGVKWVVRLKYVFWEKIDSWGEMGAREKLLVVVKWVVGVR